MKVFVRFKGPRLIIKRFEPEPHYEVHFYNRVEFWDMEFKKKIAESNKVEKYEPKT